MNPMSFICCNCVAYFSFGSCSGVVLLKILRKLITYAAVPVVAPAAPAPNPEPKPPMPPIPPAPAPDIKLCKVFGSIFAIILFSPSIPPTLLSIELKSNAPGVPAALAPPRPPNPAPKPGNPAAPVDAPAAVPDVAPAAAVPVVPVVDAPVAAGVLEGVVAEPLAAPALVPELPPGIGILPGAPDKVPNELFALALFIKFIDA